MPRFLAPSHSFFAVLVLTLICSTALAVPQGPVIGNITLALGTVTGVDQDGDTFEVARGAAVYAGYTLETGNRSFVRVVMNDGTRMTLSQNGSTTLDKFSFNESTNEGGFDMTVRRGGFRYSSGKLGQFSSRRQHSTISTPSAVIGVRGTEFDIVLDGRRVHVSVIQGVVSLTVTTASGVVISQSFGDGEETQFAEVTTDGDIVSLPEESPLTQQLRTAVDSMVIEAAAEIGVDPAAIDDVDAELPDEAVDEPVALPAEAELPTPIVEPIPSEAGSPVVL